MRKLAGVRFVLVQELHLQQFVLDCTRSSK